MTPKEINNHPPEPDEEDTGGLHFCIECGELCDWDGEDGDCESCASCQDDLGWAE